MTPKEWAEKHRAIVYGTDKVSPSLSEAEAKERLAEFDAAYKKDCCHQG